MGYYLDLSEIQLMDYCESLKIAPLIPSQKILLTDIDNIFNIIKATGISDVGELQQALKSKSKIEAFSIDTGIDNKYLTVLRREINSWHPKPRKITDFPYVQEEIKDKLLSLGIKTTVHLFDRVKNKDERDELRQELGCSDEDVLHLAQLVDVCRLRYVNETFATLLNVCGYTSIKKVRNADYEELHEKINALNKEINIYGCSMGIKDMKFMINTVPADLEEMEF